MLMNRSLGISLVVMRKNLRLTASLVMKTVSIVTLSLPQVWIAELKINTIYSKRESSLTMDVAVNVLKVFNCFGLYWYLYFVQGFSLNWIISLTWNLKIDQNVTWNWCWVNTSNLNLNFTIQFYILWLNSNLFMI